MTDPPSADEQSPSNRWRRPLYGAAISLAVFVVARTLGARVYPIGMHPFENQILFMGTPFLVLAFTLPGASSLGIGAATIVNTAFWGLLGAAIALQVRRPLMVLGLWLLVAGIAAALATALLMVGFISGSP